MNTRHGVMEDGRGEGDVGTDTAVYALTGVLGLLLTAVGGFLFYPALVDLTRPLRLLSTTALVFILLACWILVWSVLEVACDRGRTLDR
ncbi:MAG: hypothetical protein V5A85_06140 [Haloarculaceae archaeon]